MNVYGLIIKFQNYVTIRQIIVPIGSIVPYKELYYYHICQNYISIFISKLPKTLNFAFQKLPETCLNFVFQTLPKTCLNFAIQKLPKPV